MSLKDRTDCIDTLGGGAGSPVGLWRCHAAGGNQRFVGERQLVAEPQQQRGGGESESAHATDEILQLRNGRLCVGVRATADTNATTTTTLENCGTCPARVCTWRADKPRHRKQQLVHVGSERCLDARAVEGNAGRWLRVAECDQRVEEQVWRVHWPPARELCGAAPMPLTDPQQHRR